MYANLRVHKVSTAQGQHRHLIQASPLRGAASNVLCLLPALPALAPMHMSWSGICFRKALTAMLFAFCRHCLQRHDQKWVASLLCSPVPKAQPSYACHSCCSFAQAVAPLP